MSRYEVVVAIAGILILLWSGFAGLAWTWGYFLSAGECSYIADMTTR